jgi:hypothetical protein
VRTSCPNCGADVEFRYDDSFVRVCDHCRNAVLRTDRGIETLGRVADLTPMESPLALFAGGKYGSSTFLLVGMAQIRHEGGGMWQEWYAKLDGRWGWLAEAQGRYYLTFAVPDIALPPESALAPGVKIDLPVDGASRSFTVAELGTAGYVAASGELPYRLVPEGTFRFVDLSDGQGTFATIDYGEDGDPPALYVGRQVTLAELGISGGEAGPPRDARIASQRLACPNCNAPIELHAPGQSQRVTCTHCNSLLSSEGNLAVLAKLSSRPMPTIPLGSKGTFAEGEMTVIGFVQRSANVDDEWYPFYEYLLYAPAIGFRWLVDSDGHWSYVQPIAIGAVDFDVAGAMYDGVKFKQFQRSMLRVDEVLGEFYWRVQIGEEAMGEDYIRPPAMLSSESSGSELNWSLATYMTVAQVRRAFGNSELALGIPIGKAPNQPNPTKVAALPMTILFVLLCGLGIAFASRAPNKLVQSSQVTAPPAGKAASNLPTVPASTDPCADLKKLGDAVSRCDGMSETDRTWLSKGAISSEATCASDLESVKYAMNATCPALVTEVLSGASADAGSGSGSAADQGHVEFSEPFELDGGHNVEIEVRAPTLSNNWAYVVIDLVNDATGAVIDLEAGLEYYSGYDDGESWSEGSSNKEEVLGPQPSGKYILRTETQSGGTVDVPVYVTVKQGIFRGRYFLFAFLLFCIPFGIVGLADYLFERKRWENSNAGKASMSALVILVLVVGFPIVGLVLMIKALARAASD